MVRSSVASLALAVLLLAATVTAQQVNCAMYVPDDAATVAGLTKPYVLVADPLLAANGPCTMANPNQISFVEAVIFDPTPPNGGQNKLYVYHPLVVDELTPGTAIGKAPLVAPTVIPPGTFSANAVVGLWFGTNANTIKLLPAPINNVIGTGTSLVNNQCVNGRSPATIPNMAATDLFAQFAACNTKAFWKAVNAVIDTQGAEALDPPPPALGVSSVDKLPCLTTRDFALVDMDPSDNVVTLYLVTIPGGQTAQASRQNQAANPTVVAQINGSDNRLLAVAMANALGCTPYKAPNLIEAQPPPYADKTLWIGAMALNEIHAQVRQQPPIALLPRGNPMVQVKAQAQAAPVANPAMLPFMQSNSLATIPDLVKVNNYREALNQPRVNTLTEASTAYFCAHFAIEHITRLQGNMVHFKALSSPMPDVATNLFAFMGQRFANSWDGMQCGTLLDMPNPVLKIFTGNLVSDCTLSPNVAQWQQRLEIIDPYGA